MNPESRIFVAGGSGLVGSAIRRELEREGYATVLAPGRDRVNLMQVDQVKWFFQRAKPEYVFFAAARVGGIVANDREPAQFIHENLQITVNLVEAAHQAGVKRFLFLGSSCIYPRLAEQPIREEALLSGPLEPTNEAYAVAKIAGIKLCQAYRKQYGSEFFSAMPTNLYGPNDHYDLERSHVLPAMIRKFHEAKVSGAAAVTCWGSGRPRREFLYVDDLARALVLLMNLPAIEHDVVNVGYGSDVSIEELAWTLKTATGFLGKIEWDTSRPDGTPRKLLDSSRMQAMGWRPEIGLWDGICRTYQDFLRRAER